MGVDSSPSTPAARPRASAASASASASASAASASAVKVARTRSARLPLASNGGVGRPRRSGVCYGLSFVCRGNKGGPPLCGVGHGGESLVSWGQWGPPGQRGLLSEEEISDILQGWTPRCAGFASPD